jgi:hypothetical protein
MPERLGELLIVQAHAGPELNLGQLACCCGPDSDAQGSTEQKCAASRSPIHEIVRAAKPGRFHQ